MVTLLVNILLVYWSLDIVSRCNVVSCMLKNIEAIRAYNLRLIYIFSGSFFFNIMGLALRKIDSDMYIWNLSYLLFRPAINVYSS